MKKNIFYKKTALILTFLLLIVSLTACGKKTVSYEGINDEVYAQSGKYSITNKELYSLLKYQKSGFTFNSPAKLEEMKNELIFSPYLERVVFTKTGDDLKDAKEDDLTSFEKEVRDIILKEIYGSEKEEDIKKLTATQKAKMEIQYLDKFVSQGMIVSNVFDTKILNTYKLTLAKKDFARDLLKIDVEEEFLKDSKGKVTEDENPNFISNSNIEKYFEENYENKNPLDAIIIRFTSKDEADQTLRLFGEINEKVGDTIRSFRGLKSYKNRLYLLPKKDDLKNEDEFQKYYNDYTIDPANDIALDDLTTFDATGKESPKGLYTLIEFVKIYQYMYSYKTDITDSDITSLYSSATLDDAIKTIKTFDDNKFSYEYEDLNKINSSLRSYIYDTLVVNNKENAGVTHRYTSTPRSYDTSYYLSYKLTDQEKKLNDDTLRKEIKQEIFDSKLTQTYIDGKVAKVSELVELKIYDPEMELMYKLGNTAYKKSNDKSTIYVANIKVKADEDLKFAEAEYNITPLEFFNKMEKVSGPSYAFNNLSEKSLLETKYADEITEKDEKEFKENFKAIMESFSANNFEQYGLPASMGRKSFIKLYFNADSIDEVLKNFYRTSKIMEKYLEDIYAHYGEGDIARAKLQKYAKNYYEFYYSTTAVHFLVYLDINEDGTPDDPKDYIEKLSEEKRLAFEKTVYEFNQKIYFEAASSASKHQDRFTSIVEEYNKSTRIIPTQETCDKEPSLTSCQWAKYKKAGLNVKTEDLSEITNESSLGFDDKFILKLEELLKSQNYDVQEQFMQPIGTSYRDLLTSSFGWHIIVLTGSTKQLSSKYLSADDDVEGTKFYDNIEYFEKDGTITTLNAYSSTNYPSLNQIDIYLRERKYTNGIENLPTSVKTSMEKTFGPIITKYEGEENKIFLLRELLLEINSSSKDGVSFTNQDLNTLLHKTFEVTVRNAIGYDYYQKEAKNPLAKWFEDFYGFTV